MAAVFLLFLLMLLGIAVAGIIAKLFVGLGIAVLVVLILVRAID